jgi:hypothetical protein
MIRRVHGGRSHHRWLWQVTLPPVEFQPYSGRPRHYKTHADALWAVGRYWAGMTYDI